jgi:hypothetical protein
MKNAAFHSVPDEEVSDAEQSKGHIVDPHELADRLVVVVELRGVYD